MGAALGFLVDRGRRLFHIASVKPESQPTLPEDIEVEVDRDGLFVSARKVPKTDKPINPDFPTGGERFGGQFTFKQL